MTEVFILGCRAPTVDFRQTLDPCNCSSYYVQVTSPRPSRDVRLCGSGELWNYETGACESRDSVLSRGLCNRRVPWNRCTQATDDSAGDTFRSKMKSTCVETGRYDPYIADRTSNHQGYLVSPNAQTANIGLMVAAFVAGCVVTLFLMAIILTFCGLPSLKNSKSGSKKAKVETKTVTTTVKVKKEKKRSKPTITQVTKQQEIVVKDDHIEYENVELNQSMDISGTRSPPKKPPYSTVNKTKHSPTKTVNTTQIVSHDQPPPFAITVEPGIETGARPKVLPRPSGFAPKPPTKPSHSKDNSPTKLAMKPPTKVSATQQISYNYIHPK